MSAWYLQEGHSVPLLLFKENNCAHYLTFSWVVLNLSLNCAGHTKSTSTYGWKEENGRLATPKHRQISWNKNSSFRNTKLFSPVE